MKITDCGIIIKKKKHSTLGFLSTLIIKSELWVKFTMIFHYVKRFRIEKNIIINCTFKQTILKKGQSKKFQ